MSHILTLHLPLDPGRGDFAGDVLAERLRGVDVQDMQAFLHDYGGAPALAVVVRAAGEAPTARRSQPADWKAQLAAGDVPLFEELRAWRNATAAEEGVRPYRVVKNRALAGVAALRPRSKSELETVPGVGPWTVERYGDALLAKVAAAEAPTPSLPDAAADTAMTAAAAPTGEAPQGGSLPRGDGRRGGAAVPFGDTGRGPR